MSQSLLILGAGGHGRVVADVADESQEWSTIAFLDDNNGAGAHSHRWPIVGTFSDLVGCCDEFTHGIVALGDNSLRAKWTRRFAEVGLMPATIISRSAVISRFTKIGKGSVILGGTVVNTGATLGLASIVNSGASIDHDCVIGDGVHVAPGSHIGGDVCIGDRTLIGIGASVRNGVEIGSDVTVGVGAAVVSSIPSGCTAIGVPARSKLVRKDNNA